MENVITGKAYVLGDNIDTDQIIPAEYLKFSTTDPEERKMFGRMCLSSVPEGQRGLPDGNIRFVPEGEFESQYQIVVAGKNFGCGSSREHAPLALAVAGIRCVIAEFYARIFYRNSINGGYLIPFECEERLCERVCTGDELKIDVGAGVMHNLTTQEQYRLKPLGEIAPILAAGGVFPYARQVGMLKA